jgi:hypothetical protein
VSCISIDACTAVGSTSSSTGFAERWDGVTWSVQPDPALSAFDSSELDGVSCASATACIAWLAPDRRSGVGDSG